MFPPWMLSAFYVISGVAVVWLLFRIWQKRQVNRFDRRPAITEPRPTPRRESQPTEPVRTVAAAHIEPAPIVPPPLPATSPVPEVSILKTPEAVTPTIAATAAPATTTASHVPSWERKLGLRPQEVARSLPFIRPSDVPSVRTDDLAFGGLTPTLAAMLPDSEPRQEEAR
ncbi:MAG: hypothetical protein Q8K78_06985, partial [Planctomycetaceae bacterium]|nr:hypothetical protein [Planctomycetaceae bacterium]